MIGPINESGTFFRQLPRLRHISAKTAADLPTIYGVSIQLQVRRDALAEWSIALFAAGLRPHACTPKAAKSTLSETGHSTQGSCCRVAGTSSVSSMRMTMRRSCS